MKYLLLLLALFPFSLKAQPILTLDNAIQITLKNNYDIVVAHNIAETAKNNKGFGNSGFFPQIALNAGDNFGHNDYSDQKYSNGTEQIKSGAISNSLNAGVALNWTLFDGMKMFATYSKMEELNQQGQITLKIKIEGTLLQLISAYYDIVRQKQTLKALQDAIDIFKERLKIADAKLALGSAAKLEVLQAKVDLNAQYSQLLKQQQTLQDSKTNLNYLLARAVDIKFDVVDSIPLSNAQAFEQIKEKVYQQNNGLQYALKTQMVAKYALREAQSLRLPNLGINAGYNVLQSQSQSGFIAYNYSRGYVLGFSASLPLFNGFYASRSIKNARLLMLSSEQQYLGAKADLDGALAKTYQNYLNNNAILQMEQESFSLAKENMDVAFLRYKLGSISSLELKDAQKSYLDAEYRLVSARYDTKVSELNLQKLSGDLVK